MQLGRMKDRMTPAQAARRVRRMEKRRATRGQAWVSPTERRKAEPKVKRPFWVRARELKAGRLRAQLAAFDIFARLRKLASRSEQALRCPQQHETKTAAGVIRLADRCDGRLKRIVGAIEDGKPQAWYRCQTCGRDWKRLSPKATALARVA
jgi:hypothetical protein